MQLNYTMKQVSINSSLSLLLLCTLLMTSVSSASGAGALRPRALFPYGGVTPLAPNDDHSSPPQCVDSIGFPRFFFYGKPQTCIHINTNGIVSFGQSLTMWREEAFPLTSSDEAFIAPFWADINTEIQGTVYFQSSMNPEILAMADEYVHTGFMTHRDFRSTAVYIVTWDRVSFYQRLQGGSQPSDKVNTFQCVLVTDGQLLFTLLLYKDIQWTTADSSSGVDGLGGIPAQIGFNAGDMVNAYSLPLSLTNEVINITDASNIGVPGAFVFLVSGERVVSGGCVENRAMLQAYPTYGSEVGGEIVTIQGCLSGQSIICDFDGVQRSATPINDIEAVCVSPPLRRTGRVTLRVMVDGEARGEVSFTSLNIDQSQQVTVTPSTNSLSFTTNDSLTLNWDPTSFLPQGLFTQATPTSYRVDIVLFELDPTSNVWNMRSTLLANTENDGEVSFEVVEPQVEATSIAPIAIQVLLRQDSILSNSTPDLHILTSNPIAQWSSQYYYTVPSVASGSTLHLCNDWYNSQPTDIGQILLNRALPCPSTKERALLPNSGFIELRKFSFMSSTSYHSQWINYFHPGAESCFIQATLGDSQDSPQQECCYDNHGQLLTGHPGGGSVNRVGSKVNRGGHYLEDEYPYIVCCTGLAPTCQKLYELRPSDNGARYNPPSAGWAMGDPHFITLDNHPYTFNGHGEFTLIETADQALTIQVRMSPLETNQRASVFTALAAKETMSDTVMIIVGAVGVNVYINGAMINLDVVSEQTFNKLTVFNKGSNTTGVLFSSGTYIETKVEDGFLARMAVSLPELYRDRTRGLLGVYNDDPVDDLTSSSRAMLALGVSTEILHTLFGSTWILTSSADSLFTYLPYQNFDNLRNPSFTPNFTVDTSTASPELTAICQDNRFCLFDGLVSGSTSLATSTLAAVTEARGVVQLSEPATCSPACIHGACVDNTCSCSPGYSGASCDSPIFTQCEHNPCSSEERCGVLAGSHYCQTGCSDDENRGAICQLTDTGVCSRNPCENGGVCLVDSSLSLGFKCLCPPGITDPTCRRVFMCSPNPCQNGGTCSPSSDSYQCECVSGFSGDNCSINIQVVIVIAGSSVGAVIIIALICLALISAWVICKNRRPKEVDVMDNPVRRDSVVLKSSHRHSLTPSTDSQSHKTHRLSLSREPSHSVLQTSPTTESSMMSLNHYQNSSQQMHYDSLNNIKHLSNNNLYNGRRSSASMHSNSNPYTYNARRTHSSMSHYHNYLGPESKSNLTQSMDLSLNSQFSVGGQSKNSPKRSSLNIVSTLPRHYGNSRRASAVESTQSTQV